MPEFRTDHVVPRGPLYYLTVLLENVAEAGHLLDAKSVARRFIRQHVLSVIAEIRAEWDEADDVPLDSEVSFRDRAYAQGCRAACDEIRARFEEAPR